MNIHSGMGKAGMGSPLDRMTNPRGHTELLTLPNNAQDLDEVSSLEAHKQVPPTPLTPSPPKTPDTQAHHPGTAARPLVSRKRVTVEDKDSILIRWDKKGDYWHYEETCNRKTRTRV